MDWATRRSYLVELERLLHLCGTPENEARQVMANAVLSDDDLFELLDHFQVCLEEDRYDWESDPGGLETIQEEAQDETSRACTRMWLITVLAHIS